MSFIRHFKKDGTADRRQSSGSSSRLSLFRRSSAPAKSQARNDARNSTPPGTNGLTAMLGLQLTPSRDPHVASARQKVDEAIAAEKLANKALEAAKKKVQAAKEQAKNLEREALSEAKRAKAKQEEAKMVSKSAKGLGRGSNFLSKF